MPMHGHEQGAMFSSNQHYNSESALKIRLDTASLIERFELNLKGYKEVVRQDDGGKIVIQAVKIGEAKANEAGIQEILRWLEGILDPAVVQGNYTEDRYLKDLYRIRTSIAVDLMINLNTFQIKEEDYEGIIDSMMAIIRPFLSRLLDNKERESYETTIRSSESNIIQEKGGGMKLPFT